MMSPTKFENIKNRLNPKKLKERFTSQKELPITTSELIAHNLERFSQGNHSIHSVTEVLTQRSYGLVLLFFALPNCIPLPPMVTSVISSPLIFFGFQMIFSDQPWLPKKIRDYPLSSEMVVKILKLMMKILKYLEKLTHPRLSFLTDTRAKRWLGIIVMIFGISIAIPLPFTNFVPALGVMFLSLGLLEKDGLLVIIGIMIGILGVSITSMILFSLINFLWSIF